MKKIISRKKFIKDISYLTLGMVGLSNFILSSTKTINSLNHNLALEEGYDGILKILKGFKYNIISKKGQIMSDGLQVPDHADGMTAFQGNNSKIILIRNHEIGLFKNIQDLLKLNPLAKEKTFIQNNKDKFYDFGKNGNPCCGGTTTLVYNPTTNKLDTEYLSLTGTLINCSGGKTPWNTWISCEETVENAGGNLQKNHGYNFEVVPSETVNLNKAVPLKDMGRFRHEAVAIDPTTNIAYQTEDRDDGLIYRFLPYQGNNYLAGGTLQVLGFENAPQIDTRNWVQDKIKVGKKYNIKWFTLNRNSVRNDNLRYQGYDLGAAFFARPEGMWYDHGTIYYTCTSGGRKKLGQIWKIDLKNQLLEMVFESKDSNKMRKCDNIIISPWGDIIVCEDGRGKDRIIGIKSDGTTYVIAENIFNNAEFAGATFSPDGKILFVNIYRPTITLAITGPWKLLM